MKRLYLPAAIAALISSPAYGQTLDGAKHQFDAECNKWNAEAQAKNDEMIVLCHPNTHDPAVIVTASRIGFVSKGNFTAPASVITKSEVSARGNAYIADLLRTIPGASINRSGPAGGLTQLRLRGSEGNHVLVLVDGIEASNPNTGEFDFASLRSEDVVRIEVLRGEQSALWGSDAIGGVVNIITRAGNTNESYRVFVEGGSFDTYEGQVSAVVPLGEAALSVNGNIFETGGYDVSSLNGEEDGANSYALNIGLNNIKLGDAVLSGKFSTATANNEFDSDTDFNGRLNNTLSETETKTQTGRISARFELGGFENLVNFSLTDTQQETIGTSFQNDTTGKRRQINWATEKTWNAHTLTFLAENEEEKFSNFGGPGAGQNQNESITNNAIAADYRFHQNALTFTASARQDFNELFEDSLTWRAGAGYAFTDIGGRIRASMGAGVKNPSMTELFGFFPAFFVGNPDLKPEKSLGFDIGYEQTVGNFDFSVDYFRSDLENEIFTDFSAFPSTARNRDTDSKREGVEFEMRGDLNDSFSLRASATILDAKENGIKELRRPEFLASATATWAPIDPLALTVSVDHTGKQIDTDFATFSRVDLGGFTLVGLNVRWSINDAITLSIRGDNLLDESYQEVVGYKSQGRGVYAGISANF